tara:strand:+ start:350 stop:847 length:498 start_codon:yes stop_codon:yes gene_type:complete
MELVYAPADILKEPTINVDEDMDNIVKYGNEMYQLMMKSHGVGLAAPQVGINKSFFIMGSKESYTVITNPKIIEKGENLVKMQEGCLSFPDLWLNIIRPDNVVVEYVNTNGKKVTEKLEGMVSRIFQHETDHLNGITYDTLVSRLALDIAKRKQQKIWRRYGRRV